MPEDHLAKTARNGGSACVIHSLCFPVGGRPASPRKSHSKSQRGQISGDSQLRRATVEAGQVLSEPHRATPNDAREVTGGQGVVGANPAVPTGSRAFSNILLPHQSQQKSHPLVKWPFQRHAPRACHGVPPGHLPRQQSQASQPVKESKITEAPRICTAPRQRRTGRRHPRPHRLTASRSLTALQQRQDGGRPGRPSQACPRRLGRDGRWRENCIRTGRHDGSYLHGPPENKAPPSLR